MNKCPYCGSKDLHLNEYNYMVRCRGCRKLFPADGRHRDTVNELVGDLLDSKEWEDFVRTANDHYNKEDTNNAYDRAMKGVGE